MLSKKGLWFLLIAFFAQQARGSNFKVVPVQIFLPQGTQSAVLSLKNDDKLPLRFQLNVFAWDESPEGKMVLNPTTDIIFFPRLLSLNPGEERKVRVGTLIPASLLEKTYRIFVEELPPLEEQPGKGVEIRLLTRLGIPIFLQPAEPKAALELTSFNLSKGSLSFDVKNNGNAHTSLEKITVGGIDNSGKSVTEDKIQGWYLLARGRRHYALAIPKENCPKIKAFVTQIQATGKSLEERWTVPSDACSH